MRGKLKILIVDDDESILKILSEGLKLEGYQVDTAPDGEDGMRKLNTFNPDYAVIDCLMPGVDGFEFCKKLSESQSHSHVKVILMSAVFTDRPFIQETMSTYGPEAFLVKPFDVKDLLQYLKADFGADPFVVSEEDENSESLTPSAIAKRFKIKGDLRNRNTTFIKLLYYISFMKSTGVLTISHDRSKWVFYFYKGAVVKSVSNILSEYFGSVAVSMGCISESERDQCLKISKEQKRRVGDVMVSFKKLRADTVIDILKEQAEMRVNNLVQQESGTYVFQHAVVNRTPKIYLKLDILEFLSTRMLPDRESYFRDMMANYMKLNPVMNQSSLFARDEYCFTPTHRKVVSNINGKKSIETISMLFSDQVPFVLSYLYFLISFQVIIFPVDVSEKEDYRYLKIQLDKFKRGNFFGILGVDSNSSDADVKKAYIELAKEYHPDKNVNYNQPGIKRLAEEIFDIVTQAYQTLVTGEGRKEYDAFLKTDANKMSVDKAFSVENSFLEGLHFFNKNMLDKAREKFEEAHRTDPSNLDYSSHLAWVLLLQRQGSKSKKLDPVRKIIDDNLKISEKHETTHLVSGYLAKYCGEIDLAIKHFGRVLQINREMLDAKREVRVLTKRLGKKALFGAATAKK